MLLTENNPGKICLEAIIDDADIELRERIAGMRFAPAVMIEDVGLELW